MKKLIEPFNSLSLGAKIFYGFMSLLVLTFVFVGQPEGFLMAAPGAELLRRYFHTEIQPKLFPAASWLQRAMKDDAFVNYNSVELPHSGTIPTVQVNRAVLPAAIAQRTDAATNYLLEELTTDPTVLQYSEARLVNYDKRASILDIHAKSINTKAADRALYKWAAGANSARIFATTGTARATGNSGGSQTGNRKAVVEADIQKVVGQFYKDDLQTENDSVNGIAIMTPAMIQDMWGIQNFMQQQTYGTSNIPSGVIRRAYGMDFYVRSRVVVVDVSNVLKSEGAASASTDQDTAVFYHPDYVRRAVGEIKSFLDEDKPEFYGSVFSMLVRFGAAPARNDNKGVCLLYESN